MSYIPDRVRYVQRPPTQVGCWWDQARIDGVWVRDEPREVRETFVVDADNIRTLTTAMRWAGAPGSYRSQAIEETREKISVIEVPNDPIEALELINLDIRGQGGRAWKVLIANKFYVDMREECLIQTLIKGNGHGKGILAGEATEQAKKDRQKRIKGWASWAKRNGGA